MNRRFVFFVAAWLVTLLTVFASGHPVWAAEERGEELAGEHETMQTRDQGGPAATEPERAPAGAAHERPTLKMPDVVIQGERQYRVTAEKRDLLVLDPMAGTKEMPADLAQVSVPGLSDEKDAPAPDTATAKNYLFSLEAGAGSQRQALGSLSAGVEAPGAALSLRSTYQSGEFPKAYGYFPFQQDATADLDADLKPWSAVRLTGGASGHWQTASQPHGAVATWGDWLDRTAGEFRLGGESALTATTTLSLAGNLGFFRQTGAPGGDLPRLLDRAWGLQAHVEQAVPAFSGDTVLLSLRVFDRGQEARLEQTAVPRAQSENHRGLQVNARFNPVSLLHLDLGVRAEDLSGIQDKNAAIVLGQVSLVLPAGTTLYVTLDGGLKWKPVSAWAFETPYAAIGWLPAAENVRRDLRAGWKQRLGDAISFEAAWFQREATDTPAWLDPDRDGLFAQVNLDATHVTGVETGLELRYDRRVTQTVTYTYREADAGPGQAYPNLPRHEAATELRIDFNRVSTRLTYRYLGERHILPGDPSPALGPAHLASFQGDVNVTDHLAAFARFDNLLNSNAQPWPGYPSRGFSAVGGLRMTF